MNSTALTGVGVGLITLSLLSVIMILTGIQFENVKTYWHPMHNGSIICHWDSYNVTLVSSSNVYEAKLLGHIERQLSDAQTIPDACQSNSSLVWYHFTSASEATHEQLDSLYSTYVGNLFPCSVNAPCNEMMPFVSFGLQAWLFIVLFTVELFAFVGLMFCIARIVRNYRLRRTNPGFFVHPPSYPPEPFIRA